MARYDHSLCLPSLREWYQQVKKDPSLLRDYGRKWDWFLRNATWNDFRRKKRAAAKEVK